MKLLKKFCILLFLMSVLLLFFVGMTNIRANAETPEISVMESVAEEVIDSAEGTLNTSVFETETSKETTSEYFGVIPETEASKWFEEYVAPYLMTVLSVLAAFCTCILIFITPIAKVVKKFKTAKDELVSNNKENVAMRKGNDEWKDKTKAELQNEIGEMRKELHETCASVRKLLAVEKIAYEDNPSMVANGTAHKIAEVINSGEKEA
jgi:hypothetical protein